MIGQLRKKLRGRRGVSLSELLVAVAILGLVTAAVATGITASTQVYGRSTTLSRSQLLLSTLSQAVADELRYAWDITDDGAAASYTGPYGTGSRLESREGRLVVVTDGAAPVQLVGSGAYGSYTAQADTRYDHSAGCFRVTLTIGHAEETVLTQDLAIRALNPP